jgi:hypothetical protein
MRLKQQTDDFLIIYRAFEPRFFVSDELTYLDAARFLFGCLRAKNLKRKKRGPENFRVRAFFYGDEAFTDS